MPKQPSSLVIIDKETGKAVVETFNLKIREHLNTEKYEAVPIHDYLVNLNQKLRAIK